MEYILGIDQGSSKTRAAICNSQGEILSVSIEQGACHSVDGMSEAIKMIQIVASQAINNANIHASEIGILFGGLTGADWPDEYVFLRNNLLELGISKNVCVVNDAIIAMRAGTQSEFGAIVIAGTAGNCAIRSPDGEEFLYHYYMEDSLQGGIALGRRILTAIYRAKTGREEPTVLTKHVLDFFGFRCTDELLRADVNKEFGNNRIKDLAPIVFNTAGAGDTVSSKIIRSFGEGLAELVTSGLKRMNMTHLELEVVLSGSVFKGPGKLLEEVMAVEIHTVAPKASLVNARYEPVVGAMLLGMEALGLNTQNEVLRNIEVGCKEMGLVRQQNSGI